MTTPKLIMFCAFVFIIGTLTSHLIAGAFFNSDDVSYLNSLMVIRTYNVLGLFTIPWLNPDFFLIGLPKLIAWDYGFFGGDFVLIKYFMYVISIGVVWGLFPIVVGIISKAVK